MSRVNTTRLPFRTFAPLVLIVDRDIGRVYQFVSSKMSVRLSGINIFRCRNDCNDRSKDRVNFHGDLPYRLIAIPILIRRNEQESQGKTLRILQHHSGAERLSHKLGQAVRKELSDVFPFFMATTIR